LKGRKGVLHLEAKLRGQLSKEEPEPLTQSPIYSNDGAACKILSAEPWGVLCFHASPKKSREKEKNGCGNEKLSRGE